MAVNRLALLAGAYFVLLAISHALPLLEASDEAAHFLYISNLLEDRALPVIDSREDSAAQESLARRWALENHQPPLYYAAAALLTSWTTRADLDTLLRPNPLIFLRGTVADNANKWLHDPDPPVGDTHLALWTARLFSLGLALMTLGFVFGAAQLAFGSQALALTAMLLTASIPTFVSISISVNNDNMVNMLYAAGVYTVLRAWRDGLTPSLTLALAVILTAAALAKITGLTLFAVVVFGLMLGAATGRIGARTAVVTVAIAALAVMLGAGWWYLRNWSLYGDPLAVAATQTLWGREFAVPTESGSVTGELSRVWRSFWMMMGHLHQPVWGSAGLYFYASVTSIFGLVGAGLAVRRTGRTVYPALALLLLVCMLPMIALAVGTRSVDISYGRLLFPALSGFVPLLVWGWRYWIGRWSVLLVLPIAVAAIIAPTREIAAAYPHLTSVAAVPPDAVPVNVRTGDLTLAAYYSRTDQVLPGGEVLFDLYLSGAHPENPALYATLIDPLTGAALGKAAVYPGMAPTNSLTPGTLYHAPLRVSLNTANSATPALSPRLLHLQLGWQTALQTTYLPMTDASGAPRDTLVLDAAPLVDPAFSPGIPQHTRDVMFGDAIQLYGYDRAQPQTVIPGSLLDFTLFWRVHHRLPDVWVQTVQLLDSQGRLVAQDDGALPGLPSTAWRNGMALSDSRTLEIPPDAQPGTYTVFVGWYRLSDFARLPVSAQGTNDLYPLATIHLP